MKKQLHRDVWVGLVLLAFCAWTLSIAVTISGQAAYLPVALSVMMAVCAVIVIFNGYKKSSFDGTPIKYSMTVKNSKASFIFMGFILLYYFAFRYITYWVATPIFLIAAQKYLKVKSWKVNLIVTVLYVIITYILFVVILKLPIYKIGALGKYFRFV